MRVLLVEDDEMIGQSLKQALGGNGWSVDWVKDGLLAQSALADGGYACVLLDLGLPKRDGIEVLRKARSEGDHTPVLVLTARDGLDDRITGLDIGADDYLVKPYEFRELLARMRAVIRRRDGSAHSVIGGADVQLDLTTREVLVQGERSQLSAREFALLHALLERPGRHPLARPARKPHLRLGRGGQQQRRRRVDPRHAPQAGRRHHPQRARPGLAHRGIRNGTAQRRRGARHDEIPQQTAQPACTAIRAALPHQGSRFQVFPDGRMCSLRRVLLMWLVPLFLIVGAASAAFSYWSYRGMVREFMDSQMEQLGQSIAAQDEPVLPPSPTAERVHKWGAYVVQVYGADGALLATLLARAGRRAAAAARLSTTCSVDDAQLARLRHRPGAARRPAACRCSRAARSARTWRPSGPARRSRRW